MIRILIVDDHALVREGIRAILDPEPAFEVVGQCGDGKSAIEEAARLRPDVVLMDINLGGGIGGLEAAEAIRAARAETRIVMLTQYADREYVQRAIRIGALGYLPKSSVGDELKTAILAVHQGRRYLHPEASEGLADMIAEGGEALQPDDYDRLSPREKQVFRLLVEGRTSREIAKELDIALKTAMAHRANVMSKLQLHSRAELIRFAVKHKLADF